MVEDREVLAVLSESLAGALLVLGLLVVLGAVVPSIELAGRQVSPARWWSRIIVGVLGVALVVVASWTLFVSHPLEVIRAEVRPQSNSYSRPCPSQASVFVLVTAQGGPGQVTYRIDFAGRASPLFKAQLGGKASGERTLGPHPLNIPSHLHGEYPMIVRIVAPRNVPKSLLGKIPYVKFSC
jgi:hypothetical protein